jgi:choloylglycine hydrolase
MKRHAMAEAPPLVADAPYPCEVDLKLSGPDEDSLARGSIMRLRYVAACAAWLVAVFAVASIASACTGIRIRTQDQSVVYARTLEFAADLQSDVIVIPRGKAYVGTAPANQRGLKWQTTYATVGANGFDMPHIVDGLNEAGLAVGLFYFPSYAQYQQVAADEVDRALAPWELATYLLGTCANVDQAVAAAKRVLVADVVQEQFGSVPECHYVVHDAAGRSAVLEHAKGELRVYANPLGVITNSPTFDWHLTNLSNYINLSVTNVPPVELSGEAVRSLGQGTGMLGLPGDFSPPSRFVRAVAFSQSAVSVETARDGVLQAFHILNQFDIPRGVSRGKEDGKPMIDYTLWTAACDLANRRYHFRTFDNSRIRMVDLARVDIDGPTVLTFSMAGDEVIEDLSSEAEEAAR